MYCRLFLEVPAGCSQLSYFQLFAPNHSHWIIIFYLWENLSTEPRNDLSFTYIKSNLSLCI